MSCCKKYGVQEDRIRAIGTAALRSADNAEEFINRIHKECKVKIEVISGNREAELIYTGIMNSNVALSHSNLIVDIGGGSVEIIVAGKNVMHHYASYNIGISQLRHQFTYEDPLPDRRKKLIYDHLDDILSGLFSILESFRITSLVGASGPFEIIESMCANDVSSSNCVSRHDVQKLINNVIYIPLFKRIKLAHMPKNRADLSVESLLIVDYLLSKISSIEYVKVSPYALKEGVIFDTI
jgi:exopolyphosphatase/guanosine-5'-triphosphate,3'-diphosphate pyrophosphatase